MALRRNKKVVDPSKDASYEDELNKIIEVEVHQQESGKKDELADVTLTEEEEDVLIEAETNSKLKENSVSPSLLNKESSVSRDDKDLDISFSCSRELPSSCNPVSSVSNVPNCSNTQPSDPSSLLNPDFVKNIILGILQNQCS